MRSSRSDAASMSWSSTRRSSSVKATSVWSSPDADALMVASGVRKSCETARQQRRSQRVGLRHQIGFGGVRPQSPRFDRHRQLIGEGAEHHELLRLQRRPGHHETQGTVRREVDRGALSGVEELRRSRRVGRPPPVAVAFEHRCSFESERRPHLFEQIGERIERADERRCRSGERRRVGTSARCLAAPARGAIDEHADHDRDQHEHGQGHDVLALADRQRVQRRRQEPVGQGERAERGDQAGAQAGERGDAHHDAEIDEQC